MRAVRLNSVHVTQSLAPSAVCSVHTPPIIELRSTCHLMTYASNFLNKFNKNSSSLNYTSEKDVLLRRFTKWNQYSNSAVQAGGLLRWR